MPLKPYQQIFILFAAFFCMSACSTFNNKNSSPNTYLFTTPPDLHLSFSGRGAASGPMLMSAMGPAGIAVGLAIDVGIGKDIEQNSFKEGLNIAPLFASAITTVDSDEKSVRLFFSKRQKPDFQLHKIGFVELPGQDNIVTPAVELTVVRAGWQRRYQYPEDFRSDKKTLLPGASLEHLKSPQSPAHNLLEQAFKAIIQKSIADWQLDAAG